MTSETSIEHQDTTLLLKKNVESKNDKSSGSKIKTVPNKKKKQTIEIIPRGLPKSNRPWKTPKKKFTTIKKGYNKDPLRKKQELRHELRKIKEMSKEIKDQRKEDRVKKHQRRVENSERRLENERKAELVQIIKNPAKLKRLKKKQLRMIEKRDLSKVKTV